MDGDKSRPTSYARFSAKSQNVRRSITPLDFRNPSQTNFAVSFHRGNANISFKLYYFQVRPPMESRTSPQVIDLAVSLNPINIIPSTGYFDPTRH